MLGKHYPNPSQETLPKPRDQRPDRDGESQQSLWVSRQTLTRSTSFVTSSRSLFSPRALFVNMTNRLNVFVYKYPGICIGIIHYRDSEPAK